MTTSRWPFPGDLPVERARQVALQYRQALIEVHTTAAEAVDACARGMAGEKWIDIDGEVVVEQREVDIVTITRAAELVGRSNRWAYALVKRNPWLVKRRWPSLMVRLQDVQEAAAIERRRRAGSRSGALEG